MSTEYGGSGDLTISLKLLWGRTERPSRGPKPTLTVERIAKAGVELADAEGLSALSMRRVAKHLGVGTMSLYRYVPSKGELLDVMLDMITREYPKAETPATTGWRKNLENVAYGTRRLFMDHKWLLQVSQVRPMLGPGTLGSLEQALTVLDDTGLTDGEKISVIVTVDSYVIGMTRSAVEAAQVTERTGITNDQFWAAHEPFLNEVMRAGQFPHVMNLEPNAFETASKIAFDFGLQRILDGIETYIASR